MLKVIGGGKIPLLSKGRRPENAFGEFICGKLPLPFPKNIRLTCLSESYCFRFQDMNRQNYLDPFFFKFVAVSVSGQVFPT